ncbi:hypothetical protein ABEB36_010823 [Hypothenemus hampei]|uniref:Uncharacterized protein n=1 Tax=Hypothenemus hampei TaxID=57062 RepID=A0ABD1EDG7_HYPHA
MEVRKTKWKSYQRKKDFCFFCETEVLNYARHVFRNHSSESEIAQILSKPIKSKERRLLLDKIRRKGNFLASTRNCYKPVRKSDLPNRTLLPCDNCLGYFSRFNKAGAQASGYTLLVKSKVDRRLAEEVFPHMRPDIISFEAKNDEVICAFGTRYLNTHRDKHFVSVVSRKMRELSKILIELRKLDKSINDMFSALKPIHFDLFVQAAKNISGHNEVKCSFKSPTFAMNIATSLKQCCDIALGFAYKRHESYLSVAAKDAEADIKTLIMLFTSNWRFEISTQANQNLNINKWNKVTAIPLASDLKLLRKYLIDIAEDACKRLQCDVTPSGEAYDSLVESVYCRVILLNRKRSGELQRMFLDSYTENISKETNYEEFQRAISKKEQILLKSIKRVVIRGKRGRGVPVLFSPDVQQHIQILLENRDRFVPKDNLYMFAKSNSKSHIVGYKILNKYAKSCGAKNPESLTSTRLRKHLATLSQLFNLKDNEIEQLATFMGHTIGVHRNSYRLPDDVYQTTKIAKVLLLMERGAANEYKGKKLDELDIDLDQDLNGLSTCRHEEESEESDMEAKIEINLQPKIPPKAEQVASGSTVVASGSTIVASEGKKLRKLIPWTPEQKKIVKEYFKNNIKNSKPPIRTECEELKSKYPEVFENKNWLKIKVFIQNEYSKKNCK